VFRATDVAVGGVGGWPSAATAAPVKALSTKASNRVVLSKDLRGKFIDYSSLKFYWTVVYGKKERLASGRMRRTGKS
jgi:hypothetical protein